MEPETFKLLIDRLERIENQNDAQLELLHKHVRDDDETRAIVDQHSTYFLWLGRSLKALAVALLAKLGFS